MNISAKIAILKLLYLKLIATHQLKAFEKQSKRTNKINYKFVEFI